MNRFTLLAALCASTVALAQNNAVIWTSETTPDAAAAQLAKAPAALKGAGLKLADGWPRVIQSAEVSGLKAGFQVVLIGFCSEADTTRVLMRAKSAQRLAYFRKVELTEGQLKEAQCPGIDPAVKPPPAPAYLVAATSKNKRDLEARIDSLKAEGSLQLTDGFPKVVETKSLKIAVPPGKTADKFLLVLGVCEVTRAEVVLAGSGAYDAWPAWALQDVAMACPTVNAKGVAKALAGAIALEEPELVKELAERTSDPKERAAALRAAVSDVRPATVRVLLSTFGKDAALATDLLEAAFSSYGSQPALLARRKETVQALLEAGATPNGPALIRAVERCDIVHTRLFIEKGAKADAKTDFLSNTLNCGTELVDLLVAKGLIKLGGDNDGLALIYAPAALREAMLKGGASVDARAPNGLSLLDLVLLFPKKDDPARDQLLKAKPALAAAIAGDGAEAVGGWPAVALAAAAGPGDAVKKQLGKGAKADAVVTLGSSPLGRIDALALALDARHDDAAAALLEKGASATSPSGLCCEARATYGLKIAQLAFRGGNLGGSYGEPFRRERVGTGTPGKGWSGSASSYDVEWYPVSMTPLARAALHGSLATAKLLLEKGAGLEDGVQSLSLTPLMIAAQQGHFEVAQLLVDKGAKVDAVDVNATPVLGHYALGKASRATVEALLKKKKGLAQVKGLLTLAALNETVDVVEALLAAGAGKNGEGKAAVKAVCDRGDPNRQDVFDALETAGFKSGQEYFGGCVSEGD